MSFVNHVFCGIPPTEPHHRELRDTTVICDRTLMLPGSTTTHEINLQGNPQGFTPLEKRGVIERTNAWNGRHRRNGKDYERSMGIKVPP